MTQRNLNLLSNLMLWLNFAAVLSIATQILFISQYINQNQLSYQFLTRLKRIPASPTSIFWQCTVFSLALIFLITIRHQYHFSKKTNNLFVILEFIAAVCTFYAVRMNYNGMFLLVFVDFFMTTPDISSNAYYRFWTIVDGLLVLLFSFSSYSIIGSVFKMPALTTYISFIPTKMASFLVLLNNVFTAFNLILFISIMIGYAVHIANREHEIQLRLSEMSKSNQELKNYAALSEKIAQDRERKRIARDIHDTVGHALTGIAAGIDAVMVLIDIDPEAAKKQLSKVSSAVKQGLVDIRKTLNQIRPDALQNYTLEASLKKMLQEYSDISHLKINFNYQWGNVDFEKTTELVIFRVIEETVTNALRHGHASAIDVKCQIVNNNYQIKISNNGSTTNKLTPGYGLTQMKERVAIINGTMKIITSPVFTIIVNIPRKD